MENYNYNYKNIKKKNLQTSYSGKDTKTNTDLRFYGRVVESFELTNVQQKTLAPFVQDTLRKGRKKPPEGWTTVRWRNLQEED